MTQAGFEPQGFVGMFEKLQQANRFNDTGAFPYLRSHPLTTERIADMQARQQLLPSAAPAGLTMVHAMLAARARILSNPGVDGLRAALSEAEVAQMAPLTPARQSAVFYAAALAASNLREFAQATRWHARLETLVRQNAPAAYQVRLLGAELALAGGDPRRAIEFLPNGPASQSARPVLFLWSRAMTQTGKAAQVAQQLQTWVANRPRDAQAWQLLSAAYAAQGQTLRAVRADAEAEAAHLDFAAAQNRLKAAQDLARQGKGVDHFEASIIDTRSREIGLLLREQALER
jgi:predicted Zn-dependent protease